MSQLVGREAAEIRAALIGLAIHNGLAVLKTARATYSDFFMAENAWAALPVDWVIDEKVEYGKIIMIRRDGTTIGSFEPSTLVTTH